MTDLSLPKPPVLSKDIPVERQLEMIGRWMADMHSTLQQILDTFSNSVQFKGKPYELPPVVVAGLVKYNPAQPGRALFVPDEAGGPTIAVADGTDWVRTSDGAPVS